MHRKGKGSQTSRIRREAPVATTLNDAAGGLFVTHIKALPGKACGSHTLATVIPGIEAVVGVTFKRV